MRTKPGFTLVEMVIIVPIAAFVIIGMIKIAIDLSVSAVQSNKVTQRTSELQQALDIIEQDVSLSVNFLPKNDFDPLDDSQKKSELDPNFEISKTNNLVLRSLLTTNNPLDTSVDKKIVHIKSTTTTDCQQNLPLFANTVYFIKQDSNGKSNLYRRVLFRPDYKTEKCADQVIWQKPSCEPSEVGDFCGTEDMLILEEASMELAFMTADAPDDPIEVDFENSDSTALSNTLNSALTLRVTLTSNVTTVEGDQPTTISGVIRVNRIQ